MHGAVTIGLITALPIEYAAARSILDDPVDQPATAGFSTGRVGDVPSTEPGRPHRVAVSMLGMDGTRSAAALCADLAGTFPGIRVFLMCGIAAGAPVTGRGKPVRLGDVVVATDGIVDYAHVRAVDGRTEPRRRLDGLSPRLLAADRELQAAQVDGAEAWRAEADRPAWRTAPFARPDGGRSTVHRGAVGSADILLRDARLRDALAQRYDLRAFEMEGSGVAVSAHLHERHWFMVRGISDLADAAKNDDWHGYAARVAAAYTRTLLASSPPFHTATAALAPDGLDGLELIIETLLELRQFRDDYQRREVIDQLPGHIRTVISDNPAGRLHVLSMIHTCERFDDGLPALLTALRLAIGAGSPEYRRVEQVLTNHWQRPHG
ncbi:hypothetical protein [Actinoplanes sp. NPDC049265]|uniref:effector-associated domain 2-containing protein n=1 Tax=Actinoplanes sp. NPDC049265 TaxID=3363902 RepID=UPI0037157AF1